MTESATIDQTPAAQAPQPEDACPCGCNREASQQLFDTMPDEELLYDLADLFKVFADTTRIKILFALMNHEMPVGELAEAIGADPDILTKTIARFNGYAESGEDIEYDRPAETMRAFEGTLYALPLQPAMLNTQGGPRRNAKAQVMGTDGQPIPNLFSAGELGGVNAFYYQGTGNVG